MLDGVENIHIVTGRGTLRMREQVLDFLANWCDPSFTPDMLDTSHIAVRAGSGRVGLGKVSGYC